MPVSRHSVRGSIVGILSDLAVDEGDLVEEGDVIASIESMKTMFPLYASASGRVRFLLELGEIVGEGDVVAEIVSEG